MTLAARVKNRTSMLVLLVLFGGLMAGQAVAGTAINRAETWFNNLKTMSADFVQIASDGTSATGTLHFRRPSRMKIIYDDGALLNLITTPIWLHVDQPAERSVVSYPIGETPLALILAETVSLRPDGYRTEELPKRAGIVRIRVSKDTGEGAGQLTLEFSENPFELRRWIIVDSAGVETAVMLQNSVFDRPLPNRLFRVPTYSLGDK
jgi:outer membrane lipoprotein-sorting protein